MTDAHAMFTVGVVNETGSSTPIDAVNAAPSRRWLGLHSRRSRIDSRDRGSFFDERVVEKRNRRSANRQGLTFSRELGVVYRPRRAAHRNRGLANEKRGVGNEPTGLNSTRLLQRGEP
jgi:hypothetical protein